MELITTSYLSLHYPAVEKELTPKDGIEVMEKLVPAMNKSFELGLKLKLPKHEVESIHNQHPDPRTRLLHVIMERIEQVLPGLTWRIIVEALRSPAVNLPVLAAELETAHCPQVCSQPI